jgi:hypothetical protein
MIQVPSILTPGTTMGRQIDERLPSRRALFAASVFIAQAPGWNEPDTKGDDEAGSLRLM